MNNILKVLFGIGLLFGSFQVKAQMDSDSTFWSGATGTVAAVTFVPPSSRDGLAHIRDLSCRATTNGTRIFVFAAEDELISTSASTAGTNFMITGTGHTNKVEYGDYLIVSKGTNTVNVSGGQGYELKFVGSVSTTNIGLGDAMTIAQPSGSRAWVVRNVFERWGATTVEGGTTNVSVSTACDIWLSKKYPAALMATNTVTAADVKLWISGTRDK